MGYGPNPARVRKEFVESVESAGSVESVESVGSMGPFGLDCSATEIPRTSVTL